MDVVILCGGMGTRLSEETKIKPKPMVEIGEKPILYHIMKHYGHYGFNRFLLLTGYKGAVIEEYFKGSSLPGKNGWEVICVNTGVNTLKGARIKRAEKLIKSQNFHLTYGDGLSAIDLYKLARFHLSHKKIGTVTAVRPPSRFGELLIEGSEVKEFEEKPQLSTGHINGGYFIFNKSFLNYLSADKDCDLEFGALQKLARNRELAAYRYNGYWQCMDNMRDKEYLNKAWRMGNAPWKVWDK